ncbi:hypothetical protein K488DRAFT_72166 [Vararia minispora EC-137]|uniref:Uncharacterized protein n=1 Tax=Vararia minispora EC-137 TaxID=1314806 RepID=A0ACB8QFG0_9AGAM|nr:hypothetical protein K488DRAFT_72166 [Vararia minispora EC-137]
MTTSASPPHWFAPVYSSSPSDVYTGDFDPYEMYPLVPPAHEHPRDSESPGSSTNSSRKLEHREIACKEYSLMRGDDGSGDALVRFSSSRSINFLAAIPSLLSSLVISGAASTLVAWLLSRRVEGGDKPFHNAIVSVENGQGDSRIQLIGQLFGGEQSGDPDNNAAITMYGLAISSVTAHLVSFTSPVVLSGFAYLLAAAWVAMMPVSTLPSIGFQVNKTVCPGPSLFSAGASTQDTYSNCQSWSNGADVDKYWGNPALISEGATIAGNTSEASQVQLLGDIAVLIPRVLPDQVQNLEFNTFGVRATCKPLTDCSTTDPTAFGSSPYSRICPSFSSVPIISLPSTSMLNQVNITTNLTIFQSGAAVAPSYTNPNGSAPISPVYTVPGYTLGSMLNPAGVQVMLYYPVNPDQSASTLDAQSGWYSEDGSSTFVCIYLGYCLLDLYHVTLAYSGPTNGTNATLNIASKPKRTDFNTSSALLAALDAAYSADLASRMAATLQPDLGISSHIFSRNLARNLSQGVLGYAAPLMARVAATNGTAITTRRASRYPLAPLCTVLALAYGYALIALLVGIAVLRLSSREVVVGREGRPGRRVQEIDLIHMRLTSARACIADRFGVDVPLEQDQVHSKESIFLEGIRARRLGTGFVLEENRTAQGLSGDQSQPIRSRVRSFKVDVIHIMGQNGLIKYEAHVQPNGPRIPPSTVVESVQYFPNTLPEETITLIASS